MSALALALMAVHVAAPAGLDEALKLAGAGRFVEALAEAQGEPDPLRRAQALLYVRHHAGDLDGALQSGLAAVEQDRTDAWLDERTVYVALSLRRPALALQGVERLERALSSGAVPVADAARCRDLATAYRTEAEAVAHVLERRDASVARARAVTLLGAALSVAALLVLSVRAGRGPRSP